MSKGSRASGASIEQFRGKCMCSRGKHLGFAGMKEPNRWVKMAVHGGGGIQKSPATSGSKGSSGAGVGRVTGGSLQPGVFGQPVATGSLHAITGSGRLWASTMSPEVDKEEKLRNEKARARICSQGAALGQPSVKKTRAELEVALKVLKSALEIARSSDEIETHGTLAMKAGLGYVHTIRLCRNAKVNLISRGSQVNKTFISRILHQVKSGQIGYYSAIARSVRSYLARFNQMLFPPGVIKS